jgi:hypothetical protein
MGEGYIAHLISDSVNAHRLWTYAHRCQLYRMIPEAAMTLRELIEYGCKATPKNVNAKKSWPPMHRALQLWWIL